MKKFWGYASNGMHSVGCTGQTVYLYDKDGNEINKHKDIVYAYSPMISPNGKLAVVKSTDGRLAVYSLETFSLIKKFRFSKIKVAQDDGFCFSKAGELFVNIERKKDELSSAISVYDTTDFSIVQQVMLDDEMMFSHIEYDSESNRYFVLGFVRGEDRIYRHGFVAVYNNNQIENMVAIPEKEYGFYRTYKHLEIMGFTEKAYEYSPLSCDLNELKAMNHTLAKLHELHCR